MSLATINNFISQITIYKGLALPETTDNSEFVSIQPKLFSNPFFSLKNTKKGKKKKK